MFVCLCLGAFPIALMCVSSEKCVYTWCVPYVLCVQCVLNVHFCIVYLYLPVHTRFPRACSRCIESVIVL